MGHPDGKWLYAASFNDGGNLIGSGVFEWKAGGFPAGETVRLQYTHDGTTWSNIALVAAVDRKMSSRLGTSGEIFNALGAHGVNIRTIAQGADELSIIIGVDNSNFETAIRVLYDGFAG